MLKNSLDKLGRKEIAMICFSFMALHEVAVTSQIVKLPSFFLTTCEFPQDFEFWAAQLFLTESGLLY